jgi:2',3'-cyclic-nucleotide 3'-phosphodiesterase
VLVSEGNAECDSHDCPKIDAKAIQEIKLLVKEAGVGLDGEGKLGGWVGGRVVLVDTSKPINQWVPIAERTL